jgi:hypothetical protein
MEHAEQRPTMLTVQHRRTTPKQLLQRLHDFDLIYASPDSAKFHRVQRFFSRIFDSNIPVDTTQRARYFDIRQLWESDKTESLTRADRDFLRDGDKRFRVSYSSLSIRNGRPEPSPKRICNSNSAVRKSAKNEAFPLVCCRKTTPSSEAQIAYRLDRHLKTKGLIAGLVPGL